MAVDVVCGFAVEVGKGLKEGEWLVLSNASREQSARQYIAKSGKVVFTTCVTLNIIFKHTYIYKTIINVPVTWIGFEYDRNLWAQVQPGQPELSLD